MVGTSHTFRLDPFAADCDPAIQLSEAEEPSAGVDVTVERTDWEAVRPPAVAAPARVFLVDGVRGVEHRLLLEGEGGSLYGLLGSFGVGAACLGHQSARISHEHIGRLCVVGGRVLLPGVSAPVPGGPSSLVFEPRLVPENTPMAPLDGPDARAPRYSWYQRLAHGRRFVAAPLVALTALAGCVAALPAAAADDIAATLRELQPLMGAQPEQARERLAALRRQADTSGRLDWRLAVDEVDCRLLTDIDGQKALGVADAGLALVNGQPAGAAAFPWLRLRACRVGILLAAGQVDEGEAEIASILEASRADEHAPAHGLALLERGLARSRRGQYVEGQEDLLGACALLRDTSPGSDLDLCHGHLANHYKRVGEFDEALALLEPLAQRAAAAGATFDAAIHEHNLGQLQSDRRDWRAALPHYERALALSRSAHDENGSAYALQGMAVALLRLGEPAKALRRVDESLALFTSSVRDDGQLLVTRITQAQILAALGDLRRAGQILDAAEPAVAATHSDTQRADFLRARVDVLVAQGAWREAFQAHVRLDEIEERLREQRQSRRSAVLRAQFNRERDMRELRALKEAQQNEAMLRTTQAAVTALTLLLLAVTAAYAWRKWHHARAMQTLALVDDLTGISNRRAILRSADAAFADAARNGTPLALLMVDADRFKAVNDVHGHDVGDEVLRAIAGCIQRDLRQHDRVGRLGGEEFLVVLPGTGAEHSQAVAERIRVAVAQTPLRTSAGELCCTVSVGVAQRESRDARAADVMARADAALYRAKAEGRDRVVVAT